MKCYSLITCLFMILSLSGIASAQVVISPEEAASPTNFYVTYNGTSTVDTDQETVMAFFGVGKSVYTMGTNTYAWGNVQGAMEFDLGAVPATFTSENFTAKLGGVNVNSSFLIYQTGAINVDLYDMGDATENGDVTYADFNSTRGDRIERRANDFTSIKAEFNEIDVTCAVRRDLFGDGQTDYSGFILKSPDAEFVQGVWYDAAAPRLTITPGVAGPDCPDDGDGSGGGSGGGSSGGPCFIVTVAH